MKIYIFFGVQNRGGGRGHVEEQPIVQHKF
jgi:hypothetical protein